MEIIVLNGWAAGNEIWRDFLTMSDLGNPHILSSDVICSDADIRTRVIAEIDALTRGAGCEYMLIGWSLGALAAIDAFDGLAVKPSAIALFSGAAEYSHKDVDKMETNIAADKTKTLTAFFRGALTLQEKRGLYRNSISKGNMNIDGNFKTESLLNGIRYLKNTDVTTKLESISSPAVWLHGTDDAICPIVHGESAAGMIPNCSFIRIDGAGHAPFLTQPDKCISSLNDFLSGAINE
jgi:pimeloyl-[acyl-carrier protein] methyl ester esterase